LLPGKGLRKLIVKTPRTFVDRILVDARNEIFRHRAGECRNALRGGATVRRYSCITPPAIQVILDKGQAAYPVNVFFAFGLPRPYHRGRN
jgi:hypothetical protein